MSLREQDIPRQVSSDREYRPETEPERTRKAIRKDVDDIHAFVGRIEKILVDLKAKLNKL